MAEQRASGAAVGSRTRPRFSTQRRSTESRNPSSVATELIERPLEATSSTACCLYSLFRE